MVATPSATIAAAVSADSRVAAPGTPQSPAHPSLDSALTDGDPSARIEAVRRLGQRDDEGSLALLHRTLSDASEPVRPAAAEALNARRSDTAGVVGPASQETTK